MRRPERREIWCYPLPCDYCGQYGCECVAVEVSAVAGEYSAPPVEMGLKDEKHPPDRGVQDDEC